MFKSNARLLLVLVCLSVLLPSLPGCGSKEENKDQDYYTGKLTPKGQASKDGAKSD